MANWSQSHFLQSLGWATLNSLWQMALLWCLYLAVNQVYKTSSTQKYRLSVLAILCGFVWFLSTFVFFFQSTPLAPVSLFNQAVTETNQILNASLLAASITYLLLLILPSYRLFQNWRYVQKIKKLGLRKIDLAHRLFVTKVSSQLNLGKKVGVFVSDLVQSPLTVGYLKPVILLPVAALNNLTTSQVEAILLHELSHIRRYDYIVNLLLCLVNTVLYFNPFVKLFMNQVEMERENCCDDMVLQFGYDKMGYASALLTLEKCAQPQQVLAMSATGKSFLLKRIEKIIGMEKKKGFSKSQLAGVLAALLCIVVFNSILIIKEKKAQPEDYAFQDMTSPLSFFSNSSSQLADHEQRRSTVDFQNIAHVSTPAASSSSAPEAANKALTTEFPVQDVPVEDNLVLHDLRFVAQDDVDAQLSAAEKQKVASTVDATKKIMQDMQWKEVENTIADAMTETEKRQAHQEYIQQAEKLVDWKNLEAAMKAKYSEIDWNQLRSNLSKAETLIQIDSLQINFNEKLVALDKAAAELNLKGKVTKSPLPDQSVESFQKTREELAKKLCELKAMKANKKTVSL